MLAPEADRAVIDNIPHYVRLVNGRFSRNGVVHPQFTRKDQPVPPEQFYEALGCNYSKFFKMDQLCKWAWLAAEYLMTAEDLAAESPVLNDHAAVVLFTTAGCIEADKRYHESVATIASPALFVYTLPNIMLGEISIRHGFKGEQLCMVQRSFDSSELVLWVQDLLANKEMQTCLCGWVDVTQAHIDICIFRLKLPYQPLSASELAKWMNERYEFG